MRVSSAGDRWVELQPAMSPLVVADRPPVELGPQETIGCACAMVPGEAVGQSLKGDRVRLFPQPPGRWRWIRKDELIFEPERRLPRSTVFHLSGPGVHRFFRTPTLRPINIPGSYPERPPEDARPVVVVCFDQPIAPAKLEPLLTCQWARPATPSELENDPQARAMALAAPVGQWVALALSSAAGTVLKLDAGATSREGPLSTQTPLRWPIFAGQEPLGPSFIEDFSSQVSPGEAWWVDFRRPLDASKLDAASIKVWPELRGQRLEVAGNRLWIRGHPSRRVYAVTLPSGLTDLDGSTLGHDTSLIIHALPAETVRRLCVTDFVGTRAV